MRKRQWVCKVCGYNRVGRRPDVCPFCGVSHEHFATWEEIEAGYRVTATRVNQFVTQLLCVPRLGYEHAAYRIDQHAGAPWIDCPSAFNRWLEPVGKFFFTHPDFMGASNQYREAWGSEVFLHVSDSRNPLVQAFPVDHNFEHNFAEDAIGAFHVGGHTPGFTIYTCDDVLFVCDYVFLTRKAPGMQFNPYGDQRLTRERSGRILEVARSRHFATVCGWNYILGFPGRMSRFERLATR